MTEPPEALTPATADELRQALAYALRFGRGRRVRNADELMADITADRLIEHLVEAGFVVMKKPTTSGHAGLARGAKA